jgi:eukaryotic-like serine/threonine-protein kinase
VSDAERRRRVEALCDAALDRDACERTAFVADACRDDDALRREVEALLAHAHTAEGFLATPIGKLAANVMGDDHGASLVAGIAPTAEEAPTQTDQTAQEIIGRRFSHYRVIEKLGSGGMGVVYQAEDVRLNRPVAVKFLPERFTRDRPSLERFQREARAASSLNHPGICTVFDIGEQDGRPFIVMELLEGRTLEHLIHRKPLPKDEVLDLGIQIADALEAAHRKGIVHRDIKPTNIFITNHQQAKILDFGVAKLAAAVEPSHLTSARTVTTLPHEDTLTQPGMAVGTVFYMSPEQARGQHVDARSDLFSFGAVLYEMATGQRAFPKPLDWTSPPAALALGPELDQVVLRLLQPDREQRYQTAAGVVTDLKRISRPVQPGLRRWWLAAAGLAVVAVLTFVLFWLRNESALQAVELTRVTSDVGFTAYPALSRDGKMLAYASDRAGSAMNIWVQQVGVGDPLRITGGSTDDTEPAFSPDGTLVAFRSERDGGGIYVVPALGGPQRRVAAQGRRPRFSPDGQWIAYWVGEVQQFARNSLYVVRATGGEPRRLVSEFFSASLPLWSPSGTHLLFLGAEDEKKPVADRYDWWVVPVDGGRPVATGALTTLRNNDVFPVSREPGDWIGDDVVFAASTGQYAAVQSTGAITQSSIWSVRLGRDPWRIEGNPRQITVATGVETQPSMSTSADGSGRLVLANTTGNREIWALPVRASDGKVAGEMQRLTSSVVENTYPSLSPDGSLLVFASDRQRNTDIVLKNLRTGTETALTATDVNEFSPFVSADSSSVLYYVFRPDQKPSFGFWVVSAAGGVSRQVCADCEGPLYGWSNDARKVIYRDIPPGQPGRVRVRDIESGRDDVLLEHSTLSVTSPRLSSDERWILFQTVVSQTQRRIFIAPLREWRAVQESRWVAVTDGRTPDRMAVWAPDGNLIYFLSERDGFRCFWAQRLDSATKRPRGEPFAVQHFHQARRGFAQDEFAGLPLSVGPDKLVFAMRGHTGNIWMATLESR